MEQTLAQVENPPWPLYQRLAFRFVFVYLGLYNLPALLEFVPPEAWLSKRVEDLWHPLIVWTGKHVLRLGYDITVRPNGSGDTTWNYVQVFCLSIISVVVALLWSWRARTTLSYNKLHRWLRAYVRLALGLAMLTYGAIKVIQSQFPAPSYEQMLRPFGEASPMGLLWTFMGASQSYNVFTGLGEMIGGALLFVRRTTLLGALICVGVLSHVVMLNFSYDVPVKLYSLHLLAMALFLALPEARRLADFLLLNRPTEPVKVPPLFTNARLNQVARIAPVLLLLGFSAWQLFDAYGYRKEFLDLDRRSPLRGIWQVEEFALNGGEISASSDKARWRRMVLDFKGVASVHDFNETRTRYQLELDTDKRSFQLSKRDDAQWKATFSYEQVTNDVLTLTGQLNGQPARLKLHRSKPRFLLTTRGFHWINEFPFNR